VVLAAGSWSLVAGHCRLAGGWRLVADDLLLVIGSWWPVTGGRSQNGARLKAQGERQKHG